MRAFSFILRTRKSKIDQENSNDENAEESEKTSPVKVKKRRKKKREKKARKILESSDEEEEEPVPEPFQNLDSDTTSQSSNNPYNNMSKLTSTNYHNATTSTPAQVQSGHMTKNDLKSHFRSFPRHQIVYQASVLNLSELQLLQKDAESTIKVLATSASITTSTRILKVK